MWGCCNMDKTLISLRTVFGCNVAHPTICPQHATDAHLLSDCGSFSWSFFLLMIFTATWCPVSLCSARRTCTSTMHQHHTRHTNIATHHSKRSVAYFAPQLIVGQVKLARAADPCISSAWGGGRLRGALVVCHPTVVPAVIHGCQVAIHSMDPGAIPPCLYTALASNRRVVRCLCFCCFLSGWQATPDREDMLSGYCGRQYVSTCACQANALSL